MPNAAELTSLMTAYSTYHQNASAPFAAAIRLVGLKVAPIGVDGRYPAGTDAVERILAAPLAGTSTSTPPIPQQTIAVSLLTALSRGRGNRGRIYPPPQPITVASDGRIATGSRSALTTPVANLIAAIQSALNANVVVGSQLAQTLRPVTALAVGRVIDTQRRRRAQLDEDYLITALPNFSPAA